MLGFTPIWLDMDSIPEKSWGLKADSDNIYQVFARKLHKSLQQLLNGHMLTAYCETGICNTGDVDVLK